MSISTLQTLPTADGAGLRGLELSQARLLDLLRHAPALIAVLRGPEHRVAHANEQFLEWVGQRDTLGLPLAEALPELVSQGLVALLDRVHRSGKPQVDRGVRVLLQSRPGEPPREHDIDLLYQPLVEPDGTVSGILVHGVDITERTRTAAELQLMRERVELATQAADLGVWRWEIEANRSHWENDRAAQIFGLEAAGSPAAPGNLVADFCHREDASELKTRLTEAMATQGSFHFIGRIRRQNDQAVRWVEMIGRFQAASGTLPDCLVGTVADITLRQQAQARLLSNERRFRDLVESMDEGFVVIELVFDDEGQACDGRFIETNPAFVEQTGLAKAQGRWVRQMKPRLEAELLRTYGQVVRTGRALRFIHHSPAMGRWFSIYAAPTGEADSQRVAVLQTDVTPQKHSEFKLQQLAAELSDADRRKDRLLATLAHELRNPLAPLRNGLALIRSGAGNEALVHVAHDMMDRQLSQLTTLVSDLLDVARSRSGKLEIQRSRVLLAPLVRTAIETSLPHIEAAGHHFRLRMPPHPVWLHADPTRIAQILNNLLDNAAKYTPDRGRIELTAECRDGELLLAVSDNGPGLGPDMIDSVFEMFSQGSDANARSAGGLGIGLALVQDLVRLHGGSVTAYSAGLGRGSVFTVRLPMAEQQGETEAETEAQSEAESDTPIVTDTAPAARPAVAHTAAAGPAAPATPAVSPTTAPTTTPTTARRWRVLIAEDNQDAGESLALLLKLDGHETLWARDGREALRQVERFAPEVMIMDIGMPGMSGLEVARTLRRDPRHQGLVLVALTGWGAAEDRALTGSAGFDHHFTKPTDPSALLAMLAQLPEPAQRPSP